MQLVLLIGVLVLTIVAAAGVLWLDARQRRIDRQIETALVRSPPSGGALSIRRAPVQDSWPLFGRLFNYRRGIRYEWGPRFAPLVGVMTAAAVFYVNGFAEIPLFYASVVAVVAAVMAVRFFFEWQRRRIIDKLFRQLPDTIEMVTGAVRSGLPVRDAFHTIAREMPQPTSGEFAILCSELDLGKAPEEAVQNIYRRTELPEYGFFAVTLGVQIKTGGGLSETLQTLADTVRERVALAGRAKALSAEVDFSSKALSIAPVAIGGLLYWINPDSMDILLHEPIGKILLGIAATLVLTGNWYMRRMIRKETTL